MGNYCRDLIILGLLALLVSCGNKNNDKPVSWVNPPSTPIKGLQHKVLQSQHIERAVGVSILLPGNYAESSPKRYDVIYYLHGWGGHESSDIDSIRNLIAASIAESGMDMPILVFPNGGRTGYFGPIQSMIVKELIPYVEANYRVTPSRESRRLLGFSVGGTGAIRLATRNPEVFSSAISIGGRLWDGDNTLPESTTKNHLKLAGLNSKFLIIQGDQDHPDEFSSLITLMNQYSIPVQYELLKGVNHNLGRYLRSTEATLTRQIQKFL